MQLLPVSPVFLHLIHHDVLGRHEWQLVAEVTLDHLRVDLEAIRHIEAQVQHAVDGEEALRNGEALVRGIIERALKPLHAAGDGRVEGIHHDVPRQGADTLRAHRIALVCHRRGTDLRFLERFLHLLHVLQKPDVRRHLHGGGRNAGKHIAYLGVDLPGIRLAADRDTGGKAHLPGDHRIERVDLLKIAVKQLQEGRLRPGGSLAAKELEVGQTMIRLL